METDIIHCHNCYTMRVDEDWICERCEQHYCEKCSATMTYHNTIDYNCCCNCSDQQHKHVDLRKDIEKNLIELKKEERKRKLDELLNIFYLKNDSITDKENVDYLTEMFGIPTIFTMLNSCCLEINLNEKTWRYMFEHEILYQNYDFIDLPTLKQIIRNDNLKKILE